MRTDAGLEFTTSLNPATGEHFRDVPLDHPEDVAAAIRRIRRVQHRWTTKPVFERAKHLRKMQRSWSGKELAGS